MSSPAETVVDYLNALTSGDRDRIATLLREHFTFRGPMAEISGRDAFMSEAAAAYEFVERLHMLRQWEDGAEVSSVYELDVRTPAAATSMVMSEWNEVRDGRVASSLLIFDTSVHDTLMPDGHEQ